MEQFDVAVVGGGTAAFEAAVAAAQAGAGHVVLFEKARESESGGNARFSHAGFRFCYSGKKEIRQFLPTLPDDAFDRMVIPPYSVEDFIGDLAANTPGTIDLSLARVLAEASNATAHWLLKCGLEFGPNKPVVVDGLLHFEPGAPLQAAGGMGGGLRQLEHWRWIARGLGVEIRFDAAVTALRGSSEGVTGLRIESASGAYDVAARATILCAGGFQANSDLRRQYLGAGAARAKVNGSRHDTGEVLMMALELGAAPSGDWSQASYLPTDASAPDVEVSNKGNRFSYPYGITVNKLGQRFVDEGAAYRSQTLQPVALAILQQPESIAFQLFDQQGMALIQAERYDNAIPAEANTIPDLARMIDVDGHELERTVSQFNHSIREDIPFDPGRLDDRSTTGIHPPKSNWATAIARPPFLAYKVTGGISFTFGGLRIDHKARVLRLDGSILPGLYASGDILGLFGTGGLAYPSAAGQTRNAVFSRLAGAGAAASRAVGGCA